MRPSLALAETEEAISRIVQDALGGRAIGLDDDLFDHGATSLAFVRVLARIHQSFHVVVRPADLGGTATARNLAAHVTAALPSRVAGTIGASR